MQVKADIRNFLLVLASGVIGAFVITMGMVYFYGPTGLYQAGSVLLDPGVHEKVIDRHGQSYTFDRVEYRSFNEALGRWETQTLSEKAWSEFYDSVKTDRSIADISPEFAAKFHRQHLPHMIVWVKLGTNLNGDKALQRVEMLPGEGIYRVELLPQSGDPDQDVWAYFLRVGVAEDAHNVVQRN